MRKTISIAVAAAVSVLGYGVGAPQVSAASPVTIDATALTSPLFDLSTVPGTHDTTVVQAFSLNAGTYTWRDNRGNAFQFTVDGAGNVGYDAGFEDFLDGAGTPTLTVDGFELSVDATALTTPTFDVASITPIGPTSVVQTYTGIPGLLYAIRDGIGNHVAFTVDDDGKYAYDPGFEDFLDGAGSSSLVVAGFELTVDAQGLPAPTFDVSGITAPDLSTDEVHTFTGVPGSLYVFRDPTTNFSFTVDADGLLRNLPPSFQGAPITGNGTSVLAFPCVTVHPKITFQFEAQVHTIDDDLGLLASRGITIAVGDTITGEYVFDPAAADSDAGDTSRGLYESAGAPFGASAHVGGHTFSHDEVRVTVRDDNQAHPADTYTREVYEVLSNGDPDGANNIEKLTLSMSTVVTPAGLSLPPFTSDALPIGPPDPDDFDNLLFAFEIGSPSNTALRDYVQGTITKITRTVTFEYEAEVVAVDDSGGHLAARGVSAAVGDTISGQFTFQAGAADDDTRPEVGEYLSSGGPFGIGATVDGVPFRGNSVRITVLDDWLQGGGSAFEQYVAAAQFFVGPVNHSLFLQLSTIEPAAAVPLPPFASADQPVLPPSPNVFETQGVALILSEGGTSSRIDAQVTSLCEIPTPDNLPPTANAGADQSIHAGQTVQLDGSGSFDDQTASGGLGYAWSFTAQPASSSANLAGAATSMPTFVADLPGTYRVQLIVTDGQGAASAVDEVEVSSTNLAPTADAGIDRAVPTGDMVALDGSNSFDPESDPLTYSWTLTTKPAGSTAVLNGANTATPSITPDVDGGFVITLLVNDGFVDSVADTVEVVAIAPDVYAQQQLADACDFVAALPDESFDAKGHRKSMCNEYASIIKFIQKGQIGSALSQLAGAIERVDGCALRGVPDPKGEEQPHAADYLVICVEQAEVYVLLTAARDALQ